MYSFVSTNDFDHKTAYVSDIVYSSDCAGGYYFPLEQIYLFDDLFERFSVEIAYAHANRTYFDSKWLKIGSSYVDGVPNFSWNLFIKLEVLTNGTLKVRYGWGDTYPSSTDDYQCSKADYESHTRHSTIGKIYLVSLRSPKSDAIATLTAGCRRRISLGVKEQLIGSWREPTSAYPYGHMAYNAPSDPDARYTLPSLLTVGDVSQVGYPTDNTAERMKQPETGVAYFGGGHSVWTDKQQICSTTGEIDPDPDPPTPPGPGPGPTPSSDPNDRDPEPSDKINIDGGPHTPNNDPLPIPGLPGAGAVSGGAFNVFKLTANEFNAFNGELYSDNAWTALKNYFNDPLDFMIGCIMVPAIAQSLGVLHPTFNSYVWSQAYQRVIEQYVELNCGSIVCRAYYGSCFDYSPYTKVQLFLPFIGYVDLDPDEIMDMALTIKYHIDVCTGDCVAFVSSALVSENARVIGQYNGNCGVQIPITRSNYDNVIASGMNLLAASASAVGTYRAGGASIGAASLTGASDAAIAGREIGLNAHLSSQLGAATMSAMAGSKSSVSRNGTLGGTCGLMGMLKPHLLVHTPRQSKPSNYMEMRGYPSNIGGVVGDFEGYLEVMDVRLNDIPATIDEINEIYELLKGGIII